MHLQQHTTVRSTKKAGSPRASWTSLVLHGQHSLRQQNKEQSVRGECKRPHVSPAPVARATTHSLVQPPGERQEKEHEETSTSGRGAPPQAKRVQARTTSEFRNSVLRDVVTGFRTQPYEFDYWVEEGMVSGKIPEELRGTYFRNGPGLQVGNQRYQRHHLDGDGCVLSLAFPGGGRMPRFINKYVRTKGFLAEQAAGRPLYRNAFTRGSADGSPLFNPLDLSFKNVANTGVLYWAGRLWALWEVGRPYELDPHTLETRGEDTIDGQIGQRLAGHYRVVTEADGTRRCICFGTLVTISGTEIEFFEFDEAGHLVVRSRQSLQGFDIMPIHDMLVTEHWYIVLLGPVKFDLWRLFSDYATSKCSLAELMEFDPRLPSKIMLFPRPGKFDPGIWTNGSTLRSRNSGRAEVVYGHGRIRTTGVTVAEGQEPSRSAPHSLSSSEHQHSSSSSSSLSKNNSSSAGRAHASASGASRGGTKGYVSFYREGSANSDLPAPELQPHSLSYGSSSSSSSSSSSGDGVGAGGSTHDELKHSSNHKHASSSSSSERKQHFRSHELPPPVVVEGPSFFSFHHVNAYEVQGSAQVVLDTIGWQDLKVDVTQHNVKEDYFYGGCRSHLHRLTIDVPSAHTHTCTRLLRRTLEFPTLNSTFTGRPYHHAYFASDAVDDDVAWAPAQALLKVTLPQSSQHQDHRSEGADVYSGNGRNGSSDPSMRANDSQPDASRTASNGSQHNASETAGTGAGWRQNDNRCSSGPAGPSGLAPGVHRAEWRPGERCFMQEPLFVPRQNCSSEDDGWIIVAVHNAATLKGEIAILDAQRVQDGPVALIRLPHALPYGLHGTWTREYLGPDPDDATVPHWCTPNRIREL